MTLTKEDLQAIQQLLQPVNERLSEIDTRLGTFDERLSEIGTRLGTFDERLSEIDDRLYNVEVTQDAYGQIQAKNQMELESLRRAFDKMNKTLATIEVEHGKKIGILVDAHVDTMRNATTIRELNDRVDEQSHRIFAPEQVVNE